MITSAKFFLWENNNCRQFFCPFHAWMIRTRARRSSLI